MDITQLPAVLQKQDSEFTERFNKIFRVSVSEAKMKIPDTMHDWIVGQFGSVEAVEHHKIVRVDNKITRSGCLYNSIRALRPQVIEPYDEKDIEDKANKPPFIKPFELTPEDVFGRIESEYCVTASNVAKYDGWHGLVIFNEPHPLKWSKEQVVDYFSVANQWYRKIHEQDAEAKYPLFLWNCLWKAAASIVHGHAQIIVAREHPYQYIDFLREMTASYDGDYFIDYYNIHEALGLAWRIGEIKVVLPLDQRKDKEVQIWGPALDVSMAETLHTILTIYRDELGVQSFNAAAYLKPLVNEDGWDHMPVILRLIDRGTLSAVTGKIGVMELFAHQDIVEDDPFITVEKLTKMIKG